jgi:hypothetical protein
MDITTHNLEGVQPMDEHTHTPVTLVKSPPVQVQDDAVRCLVVSTLGTWYCDCHNAAGKRLQ